MKKILALFLSVLMVAALLPTSLVAHAEDVTQDPFYVVNWGREFHTGDYDNLYWMPYTWINTSKFSAESDSVDIGLYVDGASSSDIDTAAELLYDEFSERPVGTRYLNYAGLGSIFHAYVKDAVDMEDCVRLVKDWLNKFLDAYQALGGELDGIAIDLEYNKAHVHYLESYHYNNSDESKRNTNIYNDIVANKVYQTRIRPKLVERGFEFYENPDPEKYPERSEIWTVYRYDSKGGKEICRSIWNQVISELLVEYINEAAYEPMIEHYPDAILSDYNTADIYPVYTGNATSYAQGKAGNASCEVYYQFDSFSRYSYAASSTAKTRIYYDKQAGYNGAVLEVDSFFSALYYANTQKAVLASTPEEQYVNAWISYYGYDASATGYTGTPYYSELIYHLGMTNCEPFLGYILKQDTGEDNLEAAYEVADELMAELTRVAGASDRKAIQTPIAWNEDYILSGMYAGGRNIWRITPDTDEISKEDFKVDGTKTPTFTVNGVTVTFPQGRIIEDSSISVVGTCGYWVETPANVTPVVTSYTDRYKNDPSFIETFSNYNVGTFDPTTDTTYKSLYLNQYKQSYWVVSGDGSVQIVEGSDGEVLSLSGTATLKNDKVPAKITAGDYYAKQQAWEVTVTLPSGSYGEITLFQCGDTDTGIKISGNKVYYDNAGTSQALSGITLSDGTYTVRREVDFRTEGAYTSSYSIYDSAGNHLGGVDQVAMTAVTVPVSSIYISATGASNAVLIDDYKLYPLGVSTSLDLYETALGRKLSDTTAVRTEDTAYRMSWMNASGQYQVARIYNKKTGEIIKTVEMAPGMDGTAAGIVEASAADPVVLAVNVQTGTAPAQIDYEKGNFGWTSAVAEKLGLAVGAKPAGSEDWSGDDEIGDTDAGNVDSTVGGEEGDNIYDYINGATGSADPEGTGVDEGVANNDNTAPVSDDRKGLSGGVIVLIVIGSIVVLAGGCLAVFLFAVKPKLTESSPAWLLKLSQLTDFKKKTQK